MNNKKKLIIFMTVFSIITLLGITFAFYYYQREGQNNNEIVTGNIYMHFNETGDELYLQNTFPETREEAFSHDDNVITFTVDAKNEYQIKDLYYGISLNLGDEIEGKTRVNPEHIMIYLEKDGDPVVDGIRFNDWNEQRIWAEKIAANTTNEIVHEYSLRIWIDENVIISDTDPNADYPALSWTNHYITLKVGVDGELNKMNMPLLLETSDTYVENNKTYFYAKLTNYFDPSENGMEADDEMTLEISGTNDDITLSYTDSDNNKSTEESISIKQDYVFTKNRTVEVKVYVTPKSELNSVTDLNFKLTRNGEVVQNFRKRLDVYGSNYCLNNGFDNLYDCILVSDSLASDVTTAISNIEAKGEADTSDIAPSATKDEQIGLYKTEDDYGDSYVFRGAVTNNNVLFGGYYWKIIRTNGDGSIRLIYSGETSDATKNDTAINKSDYTYSVKYPLEESKIGERKADPTYVGYMYGKNFSIQTGSEATYNRITASTLYYFADDYEFDQTYEVFKLKKKELEPVAYTFEQINETDTETGKKLYELYPYTCLATSASSYCEFVAKINSVTSSTAAKIQHISYSSTDKASTRTNELSSNVKIQLEKWYEENLIGQKDINGNLLTDYIVDNTFCNDRSSSHEYFNSGYLVGKHTYFNGYTRLVITNPAAPTLKCSSDINDRFSSTTSKGNGLLKYPIALITADEVALAGGKNDTVNENYYLRTNGYFWTMTPAHYFASNSFANVMNVIPDGALHQWGIVSNTAGIRAVINLSSNVKISSGDGSIENPFQLSIQ